MLWLLSVAWVFSHLPSTSPSTKYGGYWRLFAIVQQDYISSISSTIDQTMLWLFTDHMYSVCSGEAASYKLVLFPLRLCLWKEERAVSIDDTNKDQKIRQLRICKRPKNFNFQSNPYVSNSPVTPWKTGWRNLTFITTENTLQYCKQYFTDPSIISSECAKKKKRKKKRNQGVERERKKKVQ